MAHDDPELRARITALGDAELARMLTVDAESYRDEALEFGREEARRRKLDLDSAIPAPPQIAHLAAPARKRAALQFTHRFPEEQLAGFGTAALILGVSLVLEFSQWELLGSSQEARRETVFVVLAAGSWEYLRIVYRLHRALQIATQGAYPVTPAFAVYAHFIPFYNFFWLHGWPLRVSKCAAQNGRARRFDSAVPTALFLLGLLPGFQFLSVRIALFFGAARFAQLGLLRALRERAAEDPR